MRTRKRDSRQITGAVGSIHGPRSVNVPLLGAVTVTTATLALLLACALMLRILLLPRMVFPSVDGVFYMDQARRLLNDGQLPVRTFPPGWPLLIALPLLLLGTEDPIAPLRAAQIVNVVAGTAAGWLVWRCLRDEFGSWTSLLGAALVLFLPLNITLSTGDMSEMTYLCAVTGGWLLLRRGRRFVSGLLLGYAALIRPEGWIIALGLAVLLLWRDRRVAGRVLAGILLIQLPYVLFLYFKTGHLSLSLKGGFLSAVVQQHPGMEYIDLFMHNAAIHFPFVAQLLGWPLLALVICGAVSRPGRWLIFLLPGLAPLSFDFAMSPRFWVPLLPFLLLGAGRGWRWLLERHWFGDSRRVVPLFTLVVIGGWGIANRSDMSKVTYTYEEYSGPREAGLWLRERVLPDTMIAAYKPYASFWAGCQFKMVPQGKDVHEVVRHLREAGVEYLVTDVFSTLYYRPELKDLLVQKLSPELESELTQVKLFVDRNDYRRNTVVYFIKP